MIKQEVTIKGLKTQIAKAMGEYDNLKIQVDGIQKQLGEKKKHINSLKTKLSVLEHPKKLEVSEHVLLRYFERVLGFNLDEIKAKLMDDQIKTCIETLGNSGTYPTKDNIRLVIKDKIIVTIVD